MSKSPAHGDPCGGGVGGRRLSFTGDRHSTLFRPSGGAPLCLVPLFFGHEPISAPRENLDEAQKLNPINVRSRIVVLIWVEALGWKSAHGHQTLIYINCFSNIQDIIVIFMVTANFFTATVISTKRLSAFSQLKSHSSQLTTAFYTAIAQPNTP